MEHLKKTATKIVVSLNDKDAKIATKEFICDLENKFNEFQERYNINEKQYKSEGLLGNANYQFYPEELQKRSPLTILNAPWGTGKTRFVENLIKLIIKKELESKTFKKIILIDAWKYSTSKDVPLEFVSEISKRIVSIKIKNKNPEFEELVRGRLFSRLTMNAKLKFNFLFFGFELGMKENKTLDEKVEKEIQTFLDDIENNSTPILLFIDNMERLGDSAWDLLKTVIKLQELPNFQIVLPLNLNQISGNEKNEKEVFEYPIEKYIDFSYYNLEQNYTGFLSSFFKDDKFVKILNDVFNAEISGKKLSVRQVSHYCNEYKLNKLENEYEILVKISKNIWNANEIINSIFKDDFSMFISFYKGKCDLMNEVFEKIKKNEVGQVIPLPKLDLFDVKAMKGNLFDIHTNYLVDFKVLKKHSEDEVNFLKNKFKKETKELKKVETLIETTKGTLAISLIEDAEYDKKLQNFNNENLDYNVDEKSLSELNVKNSKQKLTSLSKQLKDYENNVNELTDKIDKTSKEIESLQFNIGEIINEYKKIETDGTGLPEWKNNIFIKYISTNYENWRTMNEETFEFDELQIKDISTVLKKENSLISS